ncbi:Murein DD-endopeptidase MepM [compost metagenome]
MWMDVCTEGPKDRILDKMKKTNLIIAAAVLTLSGGAYFFSKNMPSREPQSTSEVNAPQVVLPVDQRYPYVMPKRSSLSVELAKLQINHQDIHAIVETAKPHKDLARLAVGTRFQVTRSQAPDAALQGIRFRFAAADVLQLTKTENGWTAEKIIKPIEKRVVTFMGTVKSNLWESAAEAKMSPSLISELAEIFAWQVDFAREVQVNDRWRLSVEQEFASGELVGLGTILSAEYVNSGQVHTAILFRQGNEKVGYFAPDGSSLRRMFLKSPIQYGRISSKFQKKRFHPILQTGRPHLGVDYAAPVGTPIRAVGDGVISLAGWSGGGGNVIKIRHNAMYDTAYKHLSKFAKGIKKGTRVSQGQLIGYVGSTGLSTGPHVHFEFFVSGKYVDPLKQKFPSADPIPSTSLAEFIASQKVLMARLPAWASAETNTSVE